jgi:hypothetical protein
LLADGSRDLGSATDIGGAGAGREDRSAEEGSGEEFGESGLGGDRQGTLGTLHGCCPGWMCLGGCAWVDVPGWMCLGGCAWVISGLLHEDDWFFRGEWGGCANGNGGVGQRGVKGDLMETYIRETYRDVVSPSSIAR